MTEHINALGQPIGFPVPDKLPRPFPPSTPMRGQHCSVVPLDADTQAEALFEAMRQDESEINWTYLPYGPFSNPEDYADWLRAYCTGKDPLFHPVLDGNGRPTGIASYLRIHPEAGCIEVGHIHFSPLLQRTIASTEAMFLMMCRVFDELGYRRYEWKCDALNAPSRRSAERLGFTFEGIFRQATVYKGRNRDTAWFAMIDRDWPRIRESFKRWLDPDNFDDQGRQRRPLKTTG
ncbi:MAG: GNAT family protein [Gammaproteobacteria bacterium]|nr:GNAT family protein [Gammaproteobacteria bacterium]